MKAVEHLCSQESHLSDWNDQGVLLNYSVLPRTEFARVWPAIGTLYRLLLVESLGLCEKDCSSEAISWVFLAIPASCFRICSSLDRMWNRIYIYLWTDLMNKETTVWLTNSNATTLISMNDEVGIRDGQAIKLMANMIKRNGLVLLLLEGRTGIFSWCVISSFYFPWNVNWGNYSSWLVTWRFCVTREESELLTDIRDFTTPWFWDASSPNG